MKRKSEAFTQALVGLFMVTVLLLLGYFTIVISGVDVLAGRNRVPVKFSFDQVGGLKDRDNVMYRGTKVGAVEYVNVTPSNLVVTVMIDPDVILREGCRATVCNLSMLGGYYLKLEEGEGNVVGLSSRIFQGESSTDWMDDIRQITHNLNVATSGPQLRSIVTNAEAAAASARLFAEEARTMVKDVKQILENAKSFVANADSAAKDISRVTARIEKGEGFVGKLLSSDDTVYNDFRETLANAKGVTQKLNREKLFDDIEAGVAAFRQAAEQLDTKGISTKASSLLESLNALAKKMENGEGTLGRLVNDRHLHDELSGLIRDVRQVIDNYRDATPITTFSSLATGAL